MRTKTLSAKTEGREPLGIVIADGGQADAAPRFSAFVWGPVPDELELESADKPLVASAA